MKNLVFFRKKKILLTNNRKIGMTDQVKYLRVILDKKLDWKAHLENRMRNSLHIGENLGIIIKGGGLTIHFRDEAHSFVCFAGMVEESGAEKCSETALSLAADDVFGNYWWYAFNTNDEGDESRVCSEHFSGSPCVV
jgi:hypothetical protein